MINRYSLVKHACTGALALATASIGIFPHSLVSAEEVQSPRKLPQHVTPWTAMPAPSARLSAAPPAFAPSLSLSSQRWTHLGPAPLGPLNFSGRITGIA